MLSVSRSQIILPISLAFLLATGGCGGNEPHLAKAPPGLPPNMKLRPMPRPDARTDKEHVMTEEEFKDWIERVESHYREYDAEYANLKKYFDDYHANSEDQEYCNEYAKILTSWLVWLMKERNALQAWKEYGKKAYGIKAYEQWRIGTAPPAPPYPMLPDKPPSRNTSMPPGA